MNTQNYVDADASSFQAEVIDASQQQLVLVDFWADWCGPCKSLAPILEKLVTYYQGDIKLVKIDTDKHQELGTHFGVRSLPTVYFFKGGQVVDQFMGVQSESEIRALIDKHSGNEADMALRAIEELYQSGDHDNAKAALTQLIQNFPDNDSAKLLLLQWYSEEGDTEQASTIADSISEEGQQKPAFRAYQAAQEMQETLADIPETNILIQKIEQNDADLMSRYQLAQRLIAEQNHSEGMDQLLEIIKRDRTFEDDGARKMMLKVFEMLGGSGEIVSKYRDLLSRTIF